MIINEVRAAVSRTEVNIETVVRDIWEVDTGLSLETIQERAQVLFPQNHIDVITWGQAATLVAELAAERGYNMENPYMAHYLDYVAA